MKIFTARQMKEVDQKTVAFENITSFELMERAAHAFVYEIKEHFLPPQKFMIFCGFGNNGGDGLAIARLLSSFNYSVEVYLMETNAERSMDNQQNLHLIAKDLTITRIFSEEDFPLISSNDIVIDALFGAGLTRPLQGLYAELVTYINDSNASEILAVDIPSGLPGEGVLDNNVAIKADVTYTFQFPFLSFFFAENAKYVGKWKVLDIGISYEVIQSIHTPFTFTEESDINIKTRPDFGHKGTFGHALIIAGSKGMAGAAYLSAKACLRTGCGLVSLHASESVINFVQTGFPEAICSIDSGRDVLESIPALDKYDAIGIGPGLGQEEKTLNALKELIQKKQLPLVLDADALNLLASQKELLLNLPAHTIITPHPGEFDRLFGKSANTHERFYLAIQKAQEYNIIIVLKGRYTSIAFPDGQAFLNPTGNHGMATGGSGDVLTGMIVSLLAQAYNAEQAAITGVYLHGLAGDCALESIEPQSVLASDIINHISPAFRKIKMSKSIV